MREASEAPARRYESEPKGKKIPGWGGEKTAPAPRKADGARCGSSWRRRPPGPAGPTLQGHGAVLPAAASPDKVGGSGFPPSEAHVPAELPSRALRKGDGSSTSAASLPNAL